MIHNFEGLKAFYKDGVALRYIRAEAEPATTAALDDLDEHDHGDELVEFRADEELHEPPEVAAEVLVDPVPADEVALVTEPNPYLDFDLAPGDIAKLQANGVRPKDAVDAGFTRVTSSEAAFYLNRVDTGEFEGVLIPHPRPRPVRHLL